ncbi:MAG: 3-carboxy-cis,cis-muconate cycloisomerase [Neorhizobium sp.]|nr:3-carboxy-cis,cis-muconate cycloisomerase [Neorhizobium sp.]
MSISAFEHPYLSGLVGDEDVSRLFSVEAEISAMLAFEAALAAAQAIEGVIPQAAAERIAEVCAEFVPDIAALKAATARDGIVVSDLVKQLRAAIGGEAAFHVHFGATSQDVIDTALMLRLKSLSVLFLERLVVLTTAFDDLDEKFGERDLMGRTRMQAAIPITVWDRLRAWRAPLERHHQRLQAFLENGFAIQFGGAAGTLEKLGDAASGVREALAMALDLADQPQWHSQRETIAEFSSILTLISGSLGKFGQDIALLAEMGDEIVLSGGGASSAMAHKQNPVAAEVLVSLARYNAVQISAIQQSMVHEQERSGAAWTLEWLVLPSIAAATGASLRLATELAGNIQSLGVAE